MTKPLVDAPDTAQVKGTADYFNRVLPCGCRSVPDAQHLPGCPHNNTPDAMECTVCGLRSEARLGVCDHCGEVIPGAIPD